MSRKEKFLAGTDNRFVYPSNLPVPIFPIPIFYLRIRVYNALFSEAEYLISFIIANTRKLYHITIVKCPKSQTISSLI